MNTTHSHMVQLDELCIFRLMAHVAGGYVGRRLHHPQQRLRKDHNHHLLSSAKPPAASGDGDYSCVCVCAQVHVHAVLKSLQRLPTGSQAPITTNQKQTLNGIATRCMFGSHSY